ncbi:MAG: HU family DNA-binding protein [Myxococcota bacterium]
MSEDKVPESLNKSELAEALFEELSDQNVTKKLASAAVDAIFNAESGIVVGHLKQFSKSGGDVDQRVTIPGFGTFKVSYRKSRNGVHPKTGQKLKIDATYVVTFSAGKNLKETIKGIS